MGALLNNATRIIANELIRLNRGASPRHLSGPGWLLAAPEWLQFRPYLLLPLCLPRWIVLRNIWLKLIPSLALKK